MSIFRLEDFLFKGGCDLCDEVKVELIDEAIEKLRNERKRLKSLISLEDALISPGEEEVEEANYKVKMLVMKACASIAEDFSISRSSRLEAGNALLKGYMKSLESNN